MKSKITFIFVFVCFTPFSYCQIIPPGVGKANLTSWFAIGLRQELDTLKNKGWQSVTYIGFGRKSNPNNYDLFYKSSIWIVNQEFYYQFHKNWLSSLAISYRRQEEYDNNAPYQQDDPRFKQEFRFYSRFTFQTQIRFVKVSTTVRQEIRTFLRPDFRLFNEALQFRTRFRLQLSFDLTKKKNHKLIFGSEQLFSISMENASSIWSDFNYRDSRFTLYYSYVPSQLPFSINIGYMNHLVGSNNIYTVHCLAFDITLKDLFKLKKAKQLIH
ncbi:MAG: DUF2490 domain-containing protein [Flavobacteriales bacterium]|nr:DUF2490 domain-containing protein [Flavobacteriales bacterium]